MTEGPLLFPDNPVVELQATNQTRTGPTGPRDLSSLDDELAANENEPDSDAVPPSASRRQVKRRSPRLAGASNVSAATGAQSRDDFNNAASNLVNKKERKKENNLASLHAKKHVSKKDSASRRLRDCSPDEVAEAVEDILSYCDSPEKQVSTRVPAALWAKVKQAAGDDIYNPMDIQDVVVEALKIKLLAMKLGITDFDFPKK